MNRTTAGAVPNAEEREVLEGILEAISLKCKWSNESGFVRYDTSEAWNPFTDDGDALRLAVRLGILKLVVAEMEQSVCLGSAYDHTRQTIVRVAAEVCKRPA